MENSHALIQRLIVMMISQLVLIIAVGSDFVIEENAYVILDLLDLIAQKLEKLLMVL
jgi:hypothetical protein